MTRTLTTAELAELREAFKDMLNYESDDVESPIDPFIYRTPDGDSCLHVAAQRGQYRVAELLLEAGVDVNAIGDMGSTPLHYARRAGQEDIAQLLISRGASTTIKDEFGKNPMEIDRIRR